VVNETTPGFVGVRSRHLPALKVKTRAVAVNLVATWAFTRHPSALRTRFASPTGEFGQGGLYETHHVDQSDPGDLVDRITVLARVRIDDRTGEGLNLDSGSSVHVQQRRLGSRTTEWF
jgi:hypothetical protein